MTLDVDRLTIDLNEGAAWRRTFAVTIPADLVREERRKIARTLSARVRLPGFRSGKVPESVMERRFGQALDQEIIDRLVGDAYREALASHGLTPISEGEVEEVNYQRDTDLRFSISFDVSPQVELSRLGGFAVTRPAAGVIDGDVDGVLERLREQNGVWAPVEDGRPADGDLVSVSVTRLDATDEEPRSYDLILGGGDAIPDVEAAIGTLAVGEENDFEVAFPDDFPAEERRGQQEHLRIRLEQRKVRELPELDDDFARSMGDFADLESLKARIHEDLEREAADRAEGALRSQLLDAIVEANPFDVPGTLVDRYLASVLGDTTGADPEQVARAREQLGPEARHAVKRILVIEQVAELKGLAATDDELDHKIEEVAERTGQSPADVYASFQKSGRLEQLERDITEQKVFEYLKEQSTITDA